MILLDNFYRLTQKDGTPGVVKARISINKAHRIFEGHFPGLPVVPGVCMLQMVREIMEVHIGHDLKITTAENMKFLSVINPEQNIDVEATINYAEEGDKVSINATLFAGTTTFFKLKATLQAAE
jgi:3-hydroxyacyl-[acyl-carrier-protein] dehydratase